MGKMDDLVFFNGDIMTQKESITQSIIDMVTMMKIVYDKSKEQGFTPTQSMTITTEFMKVIFGSSNGKENKEK